MTAQPPQDKAIGTGPDQMVFLVGPPRCGSTWLQSMLGNHPDIGTLQESHLFNHFLGSMMDSWDHMAAFDDGRGGIGLPAYVTRDVFDQLLTHFATDIFSSVPEFHQPIFLDKTPDHIRHLDQIKRIFPEAKVIVLLRKPEDVIESLMSAGQDWGKNWAPKSVLKAVHQYRYFFNTGAEKFARSNENNVYVTRYEQLKENPEVVLHEILNYLSLEHTESTLKSMTEQPCVLRKYGEFGGPSGSEVIEPEGFARKKKGKLNYLQRGIVNMALWRHRHALGY